jgi:signal transduction histidine kinase
VLDGSFDVAGKYLGTWRLTGDRHTVSVVNVSATSAATMRGDGLDREQSRPWWERLLLEAELGSHVNDPGDHPEPASSRSARDWVVDLVMFGYAVLAAGATAVNDRNQFGTAMLVINSALAAVACVSLWSRKRHPLGVAWLTVALSTLSSASVHAAQVAIFSTGIHARPRRAVEATIGAIAATAVNCAIYTGAHGHDVFSWNFFLRWSANTIAAFAFGSFIRVRRQLVISLQDRARRAESEQQLRVREAQLAERTRIAREMHDVLAHRISLLSVHAGALEFNPDASRQEFAQGLSVIRSSARAAQQELREVIGVLRTDPDGETVDPPQPTIADLEQLIAECRHAAMNVTVIDELADRPLPVLVGRTVYRVVQEGLTNIRKHAPTQPVSISIAGSPGAGVEVDVVNRPTVGHSPSQTEPPPEHVGSGTGLIGLAERVALAGGTLEHQPRNDGGFRLTAKIPWTIAGDDPITGSGVES